MQDMKVNNDCFSYHQVEDNGIITLKEQAQKLSTTLSLRNEMVSLLNTVKESGDVKGLMVHYSNQYDSNAAYKKYLIDVLENKDTLSSSQQTRTYKNAIMYYLKMMYTFPIPVVVGVVGHMGPDSFGLALAHEVRIAAESAIFHNPNPFLGFPPSAPLSFFMTRSLGYHKTTELLLTKSEFTAREALDLGLITRIVPEQDVEACCLEQLNALKKVPPHALIETRRLLQPDMNEFQRHFDTCFEGALKCLFKMKG